jgi:3-oxoacyl-[acyl-carrier-protein] synthase II
MNNKNQVVITGVGLVTPVGNSTQETWNAIKQGQSGLSFLSEPEFKDCPCKVAGRVTGEEKLIDEIILPKNKRKTSRFIQLALVAAKEAMNDAGISKTFPENRNNFGAYIGVGIGGADSIIDGTRSLDARGPKSISPFMLPKAMCNEVAAWLAIEWGIKGPTFALVNACSSSADSIGMAYRAIKDGYADYMMTGGTESALMPLGLTCFGNMRALSSWKGDPKNASRPFEKNRSGFVMAEGAGILILERKDLAQKRGAHIYAEIIGYGSTCDAYHITAVHPEGEGAVRATKNALQEAKINPSEVGYINAHGTATAMGDVVETKVIKNVFPQNNVLVSSTKSMTGHALGAAGAIEISLSALALQNQIVPPTISLDEPDPQCDLDYVAHTARDVKNLCYAISNSFGFGGANSVVVLKK